MFRRTKEGKKKGLHGWLKEAHHAKEKGRGEHLQLHTLTPTGDFTPAPRYGHCMTMVEREFEGTNARALVVLGGINVSGQDLSDLFAFHPSSCTWVSLEQNFKEEKDQVDCIKRRFASLVEYHKALYLFGGKNKFFLNDIWRFDLENLEWEFVVVQGKDKPSARMGHTSVVYSDAMWVFGGFDSSGFACNDMWKYEFATQEWTKIKYSGSSIIDCRYHHGAVVHEDKMFVYGGKGDVSEADSSLFAFSFEWNRHEFVAQGPGERWGHAFGFHPYRRTFVVHGGQNKGGKLMDYHELDMVSLRWHKVDGKEDGITPRCYHALVFNGDQGYLYGGSTDEGVCGYIIEIWDDSYRLSLQSLPSELALLIFSHLSCHDLGRVTCVCRQWREVGLDDELWKGQWLYLKSTSSSCSRDDEALKGFRAKVIAHETRVMRWKAIMRMEKVLSRNFKPKIVSRRKGNGIVSLKVSIIGDMGVGRLTATYLLGLDSLPEYISRPASAEHKAHILVDSYPYSITLYVPDLWGKTEKDDKDRQLGYCDSDAFILCFSMVDRNSFNNVADKWLKEIQVVDPHAPYILCGTKLDLYDEALIANPEMVVSQEEAREMAVQLGAVGFFPISAATQKGIKDMFDGAFRAAIYELEETTKKKEKCIIQ